MEEGRGQGGTRVWAQEEGSSGDRADWRQVGMVGTVLVKEEEEREYWRSNGEEMVFDEAWLVASGVDGHGEWISEISGEQWMNIDVGVQHKRLID